MQDNNTLIQLEAPGPMPGSLPIEEERLVPRTLTGREKAAIVVRLLLNEGADIPLEDLPEDLQIRLTHQMGTMGLVDRVTLASVAQEFANALEGVGLSFPHGLAGALDAMTGKIGATTAARLRKEAGVRQVGDPWQRLRGLDAEELAAMAQAESTEIAAVMLSKLETAKAAEMLGKLPGPIARRITYAVSQTGRITPEAVDRIGWSLATQLDQRPVTAFDDDPGRRVGAILNESTASTRDGLLNALDEEDADFASTVRKEIFTFAHIPLRLAPRDVPAVIRDVDQAALVSALAGAQTDEDRAAADFLLSSISGRLAENLREEMGERGKVRQAEAEQAMTEIVSGIRAQVDDGTIALIQPETEEAA